MQLFINWYSGIKRWITNGLEQTQGNEHSEVLWVRVQADTTIHPEVYSSNR